MSTERYVGKGRRSEIVRAAMQHCSGEVARAVVLISEKMDRATVKAEYGTRAVSFNTKVAENILSGRLVWTEPTAIRRTERSARQILRSPNIGENTRGHMEILRDRCEEERMSKR